MTTIEHALLDADLVLAAGLNRRFGWQLAALAGVCAVLPDWDGLAIQWSVPLFDTAHRSWGHGLLTSAPAVIVSSGTGGDFLVDKNTGKDLSPIDSDIRLPDSPMNTMFRVRWFRHWCIPSTSKKCSLHFFRAFLVRKRNLITVANS